MPGTHLLSQSSSFEGPPDSPDTRRRLVAKIMADNGRCWADRTWRIEDVQVRVGRMDEIGLAVADHVVIGLGVHVSIASRYVGIINAVAVLR